MTTKRLTERVPWKLLGLVGVSIVFAKALLLYVWLTYAFNVEWATYSAMNAVGAKRGGFAQHQIDESRDALNTALPYVVYYAPLSLTLALIFLIAAFSCKDSKRALLILGALVVITGLGSFVACKLAMHNIPVVRDLRQ
jgi:hypothetical protein